MIHVVPRQAKRILDPFGLRRWVLADALGCRRIGTVSHRQCVIEHEMVHESQERQ